ncbi:transcription factor kayak isoform X2 [Coccinella septempunctata]|uniref:transcription factor kayak isoform X2 n=1 Tax=Coccinella septempunctata TaxID=41139 RepID=UPI001D061B4F|nr:transcription factor kayak isoform X2 [Coccinella septempunctata]
MSQLVPYLNFGLEDTHSYESDYFYNHEISRKKMFIAFEGLNSGVPTRTTPTLTPTTLRNIEQTFIELQSKPESHENEAGFVPPLVQAIGNNQYVSVNDIDIYSNNKSPNLWHSSLSQSSSDSNTRSTPPLVIQKVNQSSNLSGGSRRNMGGRKPTKDVSLSPEDEERRKIRRERNKAAAARCRKRRVDHTNRLIAETEELQAKKASLQKEYDEYLSMKRELEFLLENHLNTTNCCLERRSLSPPEIKPHNPTHCYPNPHQNQERIKIEVIDQLPPVPVTLDSDIFSIPSPAKQRAPLPLLSSTVPISKPSRPNSLNVAATAPKSSMDEIAGVSITTPSNGMQFNFDSLMVGGTGLTPVSGPLPTCSIQQRNLPISIADVTSPDTCNPPKLVSL